MPGNDSGLALTLKHSDRATDCQYAAPRVGPIFIAIVFARQPNVRKDSRNTVTVAQLINWRQNPMATVAAAAEIRQSYRRC